MRAFTWATLFTFTFLLCLSFLGEELRAYSPPSAAEAAKWASALREEVGRPIEPSPLTVIGDLWRALGIFVRTVGYSTVLVPLLLADLGLPVGVVAILSAVVYFIYGVTLIEFLRGKDIS